MIYYLINLGLQFVSRKIFLDYLGTEILGLNTTATNLLEFLNLAELGITAGVSFALFKPIAEDDKEAINDIISLQGHLFRWIAFVIICGAIILMAFFPLIFEKIKLPLWYAYASFSVLLLSSLLGYFFNYKQVLLSASQQNYKILYSYKSVIFLKIIFQICAIRYLKNGYVWWLILEGGFAILSTVSLVVMTKKTFPYLKKSQKKFKELRQTYSELTTKIKQLFYHKIGGFALAQCAPLIIYAYTSLSVVAYYGNYLVITLGMKSLVGALFNSMAAGVGNLVAEGNDERIRAVFRELFSVRFLIVTTLCFVVFNFTPSLIKLWIGYKYLLPTSTLLLMVLILYIELFRYTIDAFIMAYGLFKDIYSPLCEAVLNIGLSILFGAKWGLNGVLVGVLISLVLVIGVWKPFFLFTNKMKGFGRHFVSMYIVHIALGFVAWITTINIVDFINIPCNSFLNLIMKVVASSSLFVGILVILMLMFKTGIVQFVRRFKWLR